ncbi:helix-turn-helix domain-containing protein [Nonomuraea angiospora]|uniref:helix-turn-helix domain-containing protein n=1 Tax=Nonomuraea angiospora TaxID=46172 RepID=UPI0033C5B8C8
MRSAVRLAAGDGFRLDTVTCVDDHRGWSAAELGSGHRLVLVRRGLFRRKADGRAAVIDPTMAYLGVPGEEEHFAHPAGGDVCTSVSLTPELWRTLAGEGPPGRPTLYVDARLDLAHRRFLVAARGGDTAFELAESLLSLIATTLARLTPTPTPAASGWAASGLGASSSASFGSGVTDAPRSGASTAEASVPRTTAPALGPDRAEAPALGPHGTEATAGAAPAPRPGTTSVTPAPRPGGAEAVAGVMPVPRLGGADADGAPASRTADAVGGGVTRGRGVGKAYAAEGSPSPAAAKGSPFPAAPTRGGGGPRSSAAIADAAREAIAAHHPAAGGLMSLAELLAVSPYQLSRAFTRELGVSLTHYRNRVRVGRALDRLEDGEPSLAGLAADLGFADQAHLTRTIRHHVGHTPTALRRLLVPRTP